MIGGILRYSRAGRSDHLREQVDVGELVQEVVTLLAPPESVSVRVAPNLPTLHTERAPLQQVFMNLIGNALTYAQRRDVVVDVEVSSEDATWCFSVRDNGPGIAPDEQQRIWQILQAGSADSSGIGLAVVRKIAETRGGKAWVKSDTGRGSTFFFTWPKHEPSSGASERSQ